MLAKTKLNTIETLVSQASCMKKAYKKEKSY